MVKTMKVPCGCCEGSGEVPLGAEYHETLVRLRRMSSSITGAQLGKKMGVEPTAMNNRLRRLEELGLAKSTRVGRCRFFEAV